MKNQTYGVIDNNGRLVPGFYITASSYGEAGRIAREKWNANYGGQSSFARVIGL